MYATACFRVQHDIFLGICFETQFDEKNGTFTRPPCKGFIHSLSGWDDF